MLWKCCTQYVSKFRKHSSGYRTRKSYFSFQFQKRAMPKNVQTTIQLHSFRKVMLKIFQARLQQFVNWELSDVQAQFRKGRCFLILVLEKRVPWTARRSNQSILKEMNSEYSFEELIQKLQYFDHPMQRADSLEETLMLKKTEGRRRGDRGWDGWMASLTQWTWVEQTLGDSEGQGNLVCCSPWGCKELDMTEQLNNKLCYRTRGGKGFKKGCCLVHNLCPTLRPLVLYSPPGSSSYGISQARILEWVAISSSRDQTHISFI